ncbi:MAG: hypothetical protein HYR73_04165 [Candidatus Eisenbacteria bacterium]|nr:hypothetical protein [Candidatus Eisenbacteria bacterium]
MTFHRAALIASAILAAALPHVAFSIPAESLRLRLSGRALDSTGWPVEHARAEIDGARASGAITASDGRYAILVPLDGLRDGARRPVTFTLRIQHGGSHFAMADGNDAARFEISVIGAAEGGAKLRVRSNSAAALTSLLMALSSASGKSAFLGVNPDPVPVELVFFGHAGAASANHDLRLGAEDVVVLRGVEAPASAIASRPDSTPPPPPLRLHESAAALPAPAPRETAHGTAPLPAPAPTVFRAPAHALGTDTAAAAPPVVNAPAPQETSAPAPAPLVMNAPAPVTNAPTPAPAPTVTKALAPQLTPAPVPTVTKAPTPRSAAAPRSTSASHGAPAPAVMGTSVQTTGTMSKIVSTPESGVPLLTPSAPQSADSSTSGWQNTPPCECDVEGTIEVNWDHPLAHRMRIRVWLSDARAVRDTVELFMGPPRSFVLHGVPCGAHRVEIGIPEREPFRLSGAESERTADCLRGHAKPLRLVLVRR